MDIIFQLAGSLLLCYYVLKRNTKDFIKQSYKPLSKGDFDYDKTYAFILETNFTKAGILYITIGYVVAFFKIPNPVIKLSSEKLFIYSLSLLATILLLCLAFFFVTMLSKNKTKALQRSFDFSKHMDEGKAYMYWGETE